MLKRLLKTDIKADQKLKNNFLNIKENNLKISCNIYKDTFFLDSYNYCPITLNNEVYETLFKRDNNQSIDHFFSKKFFEQFNENKKKFTSHKKVFVLGSSAVDNYYSNLIHFLPRLFFNTENNLKIGIHRSLSNKFRDFISNLNKQRNISFSFIYLDDSFYKFEDSYIPEFFNLNKSIEVINHFIKPQISNQKYKKIYITREDSNYRKLINEFDIMPILQKNGYTIINPRLYSIEEQINIFANAEHIVGTHGSNLSNIIFCKEGANVCEICPELISLNEINLRDRYKNICDLKKLNFKRIIADVVDVEAHSKLTLKFIDKKFLDESNYYKNLILKLDDLKEI